MSDAFNPYYEWLGIPAKHQPADHYRLLGIERFEADPIVIEHAANQRLAFLRTLQTGEQGKLANQLLNEVSRAKTTLLEGPAKTDYDKTLKAKAKNKAKDSFSNLQIDLRPNRRRGKAADSGQKQSPSRVLRAVILLIMGIGALASTFYFRQQQDKQERDEQTELALQEKEANQVNEEQEPLDAQERAKAAEQKLKEQKAKEAQEQKEEAKQKAIEEAAQKAKEAEKKAKEAEKKAKEEAKQKAIEEAERQAKADAEQKAKEAQEQKKAAARKWLEKHFEQQKSGVWCLQFEDEWARKKTAATTIRNHVSKLTKGKKSAPAAVQAHKQQTIVIQKAHIAYQKHLRSPPLNPVLRKDWTIKRLNLENALLTLQSVRRQRKLTLDERARTLKNNLDELKQFQSEFENLLDEMASLHREPQIEQLCLIDPVPKLQDFDEKKKQAFIDTLQGAIKYAIPIENLVQAYQEKILLQQQTMMKQR